jgi:regulator of sirC expression with transglutaminase-like and TPR domain
MVLEKRKVEKWLEEQGGYFEHDMMLLREKLDKIPDSEKKALLLRGLDAMIMRTEANASALKATVSELQDDIKLTEHRAETLKMIKKTVEKT